MSERSPAPETIVSVAVPAPVLSALDYGSAGHCLERGARVVVPLGRRTVVGVVLAVNAPSNVHRARLKSVLAVLDAPALLGADLIDLLCFAAHYYQHPIGEVCATALPTRLRKPEPFVPAGELAYALTEAGRAALLAGVRSRHQRTLLEALSGGALPRAQLLAAQPKVGPVLNTAMTRQWVERLELRRWAPPARASVLPPLNSEQHAAVHAIRGRLGQFQSFLLEGVTGSGKTEVYLAVVKSVVSLGLQALLLVPEIGLTPQFIARLRDRLSVRLGVLHSELGDQERAQTWVLAAQGQLDVVVGTRSALFTPMPRLGLIVVDEEHDGSFKQGEGFRYSARDLALKRAQLLGIPVVLGTATPALETLRHAEQGRHVHLHLRQRFGNATRPDLQWVDLRQRPCFEGLSDLAIAAVRSTLDRGEQALVFRNQRGFAPVFLCHDCGWHPACEQCARPLTWHRAEARLRCHHCGASTPQPRACPSCGGLALRGQGVGTERLEQFLASRFPDVPLLRLDRDSLARKGALAQHLQQIHDAGAAIVVGTQLLAKGHHWPRVTLVVVVDVDSALFSVDFRAGEKLAQLVVQVAGRAGRAERPGRVLLQTHQPDHPLLQALLRGGYRAALAVEQREREEAGFPPFTALALIRCEARSMDEALRFLAEIRAMPGWAGVEVSVPIRAPMPLRAGLHRAQLWLQAAQRAALQRELHAQLHNIYALKRPPSLRFSIDVDPVDLS